MAYAFKKIDDLLDKEKKQSNTNIFQPTEEQQKQQEQTEQKRFIPPSEKMSTASAPSLTSQTTSAASERPSQKQQYSERGAYRAAVEGNTGKTQIPGVIGRIGDSLQRRKEELQREADRYSQAQREEARRYERHQEDVERAAQGDTAAQERIGSVLNPPMPGQVPDFKPGTFELPPGVNLNTPEGIRKELYRGKSPEYSRGESDFDLLTLSRTKEFPSKLRDLLNQQKELSTYSKSLAEERKKQAEEYIKNKIAEQKGLTEQELEKYSSDLRRKEEEKLAKWERYLTGRETEDEESLEEKRQDLIFQKKNELLKKLIGNIPPEQRNEGLYKYLKEYVDKLQKPSAPGGRDYFSGYNPFIEKERLYTPGAATAEDFYTEDEAKRYSNIMKLLGKSGVRPGMNQNIADLSEIEKGIPFRFKDKEFFEKNLKDAILNSYDPFLKSFDEYSQYSNLLDYIHKNPNSLSPEEIDRLAGSKYDIGQSGSARVRNRGLIEKEITDRSISETQQYFKRLPKDQQDRFVDSMARKIEYLTDYGRTHNIDELRKKPNELIKAFINLDLVKDYSGNKLLMNSILNRKKENQDVTIVNGTREKASQLNEYYKSVHGKYPDKLFVSASDYLYSPGIAQEIHRSARRSGTERDVEL